MTVDQGKLIESCNLSSYYHCDIVFILVFLLKIKTAIKPANCMHSQKKSYCINMYGTVILYF